MATSDTKDRIISAAERLFAERGFAGTSLRTVTAEAGVNLAAVHYHFGTKDALLRAVFERRIVPVNQQRTLRLDRLLEETGAGGPSLEAILEAFLSPIMELKRDLEGEGLVWSRFIGRVYSEPQDVVESMIRDHFEDVGRRFVQALSKCLPHLSEGEIVERLHFTIGAMSHTLTDLHRIVLPDSSLSSSNGNKLQHMIAFLAAAFRAPSAVAEHDPGNSAGATEARAR